MINNIYEILNIGNNNIEETIIKCINNTRHDLRNIVQKQRCKIYSSYFSDLLKKEHITHKIINTLELGYDYDHHFVLVPKDSNCYYLIDLTYSQFETDRFSELLDNGYIVVNDAMFSIYLSIVTGKIKENNMDDVYLNIKH